MSDENGPGDEFELSAFWRALQDFEDGTLDPGQRDELMALLESSQAARLAYFEYFQQSVLFQAEGAKLDEAGRLPVVEDLRPTRQLFRRSVMVAAVVTGLLAVIATLIVVKQPEPKVLTARVAAETRWEVVGEWAESESGSFQIVEGSTVRVSSGTLELKMESGMALVMQGPAEVSFPKPSRPVVQYGWLWVDSGDEVESDDFELHTPGLIFRDIGTRFGVRVPRKGAPEIHLIEGRVLVHERDGGGEVADVSSPGKAFTLHEDGQVEERELAHDPFPGVSDLLAAEGNIHTTILSQSPSGYWKLEELRPGGLANEISGGTPGGHGMEVRLGDPGVGKDAGFRGFPPENRALHLTGHRQRSLIIGLGGPRGVSLREGGVSFWIRSDSDSDQEEALWLAGRTTGDRLEPTNTDLYTGLTRSGQVCFCFGDRQFGHWLISPQKVRDGKWHHVAASWGPKTLDLFVDSQLVARDGAPEPSEAARLTGRYVRFGKPGLDGREDGAVSFQGWVDEIAMWTRPLTHEEVLHQFESARMTPE